MMEISNLNMGNFSNTISTIPPSNIEENQSTQNIQNTTTNSNTNGHTQNDPINEITYNNKNPVG